MLSFFRLAGARQLGVSPATQVVQSVGLGRSVPTFDDVYAEHFDYVWRTARRLGVRREEADDVVQEIFLAVHRLLPRYETGNIRGWLYSIAVRTVLHHHRAMRRVPASLGESEEL